MPLGKRVIGIYLCLSSVTFTSFLFYKVYFKQPVKIGLLRSDVQPSSYLDHSLACDGCSTVASTMAVRVALGESNQTDYLNDKKHTYRTTSVVPNHYSGAILKDQLTELDMAKLPRIHFLDNFKNPCFLVNTSDATLKIWCLPYFFLGGIEKCGTTDLFSHLVMHPDIVRTETKEPHWWSKTRIRSEKSIVHYIESFYTKPAREIVKGGLSTTKDFAVASGDAHNINDSLLVGVEMEHAYPNYNSVQGHSEVYGSFAGIYHSKVTLDASADTVLFHPSFKRLGQALLSSDELQARYFTPAQMRHVLPDAKFVVIVRNPVHRLYSSYNFFSLGSSTPRSAQDFHAKASAAVTWFSQCLDRETNASVCYFVPPTRHNPLFGLITHFQMGFYGEIFQKWLEYYSKDNFKIVLMEDYSKSKGFVLGEIFSFLRLSPLPSQTLQKIEVERRIKNRGSSSRAKMLNETYSLLLNTYKPSLRTFASLFGNQRLAY